MVGFVCSDFVYVTMIACSKLWARATKYYTPKNAGEKKTIPDFQNICFGNYNLIKGFMDELG